jgi:hypothetical protein
VEDARCISVISPGSWWSCETDPDISVAGFESPPSLMGILGEETWARRVRGEMPVECGARYGRGELTVTDLLLWEGSNGVAMCQWRGLPGITSKANALKQQGQQV